jgi:hypothetical protein
MLPGKTEIWPRLGEMLAWFALCEHAAEPPVPTMIRGPSMPASGEEPTEESERATLLSPPPDFGCDEGNLDHVSDAFDTLPDDFAFVDRATSPDAYRAEMTTIPEDRSTEPCADERDEHHDTEPAPPPDGSEPQ